MTDGTGKSFGILTLRGFFILRYIIILYLCFRSANSLFSCQKVSYKTILNKRLSVEATDPADRSHDLRSYSTNHNLSSITIVQFEIDIGLVKNQAYKKVLLIWPFPISWYLPISNQYNLLNFLRLKMVSSTFTGFSALQASLISNVNNYLLTRYIPNYKIW